MFSKFNIEDRNIFKTCVVATMSSGKSTFINAIIGEEILPEKNEACTARAMAVLDNDLVKNKKVHIIRNNGAKEVIDIDSREILDQINNDADVSDFLVETNIESIKNSSRALILIDTPGVNNSEDLQHGKRTEALLEQVNMGLIIYLLNATQLATNDDALLLQMVSDRVKKSNGSIKIIFAINKIDALDLETESIRDTVLTAKKYIESHGIEKPVIYPISALSAKILRMAYYKKSMTRREKRRLEDIYNNYKASDNNMLSYAMLEEESGDFYEIGSQEVTGQELLRAIENTGITAVERKIEDFMNQLESHYTPEIIIKNSFDKNWEQKFHERITALSEESNIQGTELEFVKKRVKESESLALINKDISEVKKTYVSDILYEQKKVLEIDELLLDIEKTRSLFDGILNNNHLIYAGHSKNRFVISEKLPDNMITVKELYYMSADFSLWEAISYRDLFSKLEKGQHIYLKNEYTQFIFEINEDNYQNCIALLDIKIPYIFISLGNIPVSKQISAQEVIGYLDEVEASFQKKIETERQAEEQLKRSYKGVIFSSVREKEQIAAKEREIRVYCEKLNELTYQELWNIKTELESLPKAIFSGFLVRILSQMEMTEQKEIQQFRNVIFESDLMQLENVWNNIKCQRYSDQAMVDLNEAIEYQKLICQKAILDQEIQGYVNLSRFDLVQLKDKIASMDFMDSILKEYLMVLQERIDDLEHSELENLCINQEKCNIEELESILELIDAGSYSDKNKKPYIDSIKDQIEIRHIENMERICSNIQLMDRETLKETLNKIKEEECQEECKKKYYDLLRKREEELDYEELEELTKNVEKQDVLELEALYTKLKTGAYNRKYIKIFLKKVRVYLEIAQYKDVIHQTENLFDKSRQEVGELSRDLYLKKYPDRITYIANQKINDRVFELDMFDLMEICNDFDVLDSNDVNRIIKVVQQKNVSQESRQYYMEKLEERKNNIVLSHIMPMAAFFKSLLDEKELFVPDISIIGYSQNYRSSLEQFQKRFNIHDMMEVPIFIIGASSHMAISEKKFYYNEAYALEDVVTFSTIKKSFSEKLVINFRDGNSRIIALPFNKKMLFSLMDVLNIFIRNINNKALMQRYSSSFLFRVDSFNYSQFTRRNKNYVLDKSFVVTKFLNKYRFSEDSLGIKKSVYLPNDKSWSKVEQKTINNFGITGDSSLVWIYAPSLLLSNVRAGMAVGYNGIYIKKADQNLFSIELSKIYNVGFSAEKKCLFIDTIDFGSYLVNVLAIAETGACILADCIREYVQDMQFLMALGPENETTFPKMEMRCNVCGNLIKEGKRFCSQCGNRIIQEVDEWMFCENCGAKIRKGKKFCSQCGTKL